MVVVRVIPGAIQVTSKARRRRQKSAWRRTTWFGPWSGLVRLLSGRWDPGPGFGPLDGQVALVFAQEAQKTAVIALRHVEQVDQDLIVAAGLRQSPAQDRFQIGARQVAPHEHLVDALPEGRSAQ